MKTAAVLYTTSQGQTQRIAKHIAGRLRLSGVDVDLRNLKRDAPPGNLSGYAAVILAASVHVGHHQREMVNFVRTHRDQLQQVPTYFVSVTLSQAGAQRTGDPPEKHKQFAPDVDKLIADFSREATDTSYDHEYTDWATVDRFTDRIAQKFAA